MNEIFAEIGNQIFDTGEDVFVSFAKSLARIAEGIQRGGNAFMGSLLQGLDHAHQDMVDTFIDAIGGLYAVKGTKHDNSANITFLELSGHSGHYTRFSHRTLCLRPKIVQTIPIH